MIYVMTVIMVLCSTNLAWSQNPMTIEEMRTAVKKWEQQNGKTETTTVKPKVSRHPYVPQLQEYGVEVGATLTTQTLNWLGLSSGRRVGTCVFSDSETCQQYIEATLGLASRDAQTHYVGLLSARWQFVNFPKVWSPFVRVYSGAMYSIVPEVVRTRFVYGAGVGFATYLHEHADMRLEVRSGFARDENFTQVMVTAVIKLDEIVKFFAVKLKDIGVGTVKLTSEAVGTAVDATTQVITNKPK